MDCIGLMRNGYEAIDNNLKCKRKIMDLPTGSQVADWFRNQQKSVC